MAEVRLPKVDDPSRWAAVAVLVRFCPDAEVLVGRRRMSSNDPWAGDAAFPGGHYEPSDGSLLNTAIRETLEETGINLANVGELVAVLDVEHPGNLPQLNVLPIVFKVPCDVEPMGNSPEFDKFTWVKLSEVPRLDKVTEVKGRVKKAIVDGDVVIWGMTRRILCRVYNMLTHG